jgi:hypothetical protein
MLSIVNNHNSQDTSSTQLSAFAIFVTGDEEGSGEEGLAVTVSDGRSVYQHDGLVRAETHKPHSRSKESTSAYMATLRTALTSSTTGDQEGRFVFDFQSSTTDSSLLLVVKELVRNTSAHSVLFRGTFHLQEQQEQQELPMIRFLRDVEAVSRHKHDVIVRLTAENHDFQRLNDQYIADIQSLSRLKDSLQDTMIQRMCLILNSKKGEIQRLQDQVEDLQKERSSQSRNATTESLPSITVSSVARKTNRKTSTTAVAAPKRSRNSADSIRKRSQPIKGKGRSLAKRKVIESSDEDEENANMASSDDSSFVEEVEEEEQSCDGESESDGDKASILMDTDQSHDDDDNDIENDDRQSLQSLARPSLLFNQSLQVDSGNILNFLSQKPGSSSSQQVDAHKSTNTGKSRTIKNKPLQPLDVSKDGAKHKSSLPIAVVSQQFSTTTTSDNDVLGQEKEGTTQSRKRAWSKSFDDDDVIQVKRCLEADKMESIPAVVIKQETAPLPDNSGIASKKKRSQRFYGSDNENDDDDVRGCLDFL